MTRARWIALALGAAAFLLVGRGVAELVVDYRWFASLGPGALDVWRLRETARWLLRLGAAAVAAAVLFVNLWAVVSSVDKIVLPRRLGDLEIGETVPGQRLLWGAAVVALGLGFLLALPLDEWGAVASLASGALGDLEPYTDHDVAFHVHWLPLESALYTWALFVLLAAGALVLACYALTPGLRVDRGRLRLSGRVRRHVTVLGVGLLLLLAWGHRLDAYALLTSGSGEGGAFTYVDHRVGIPLRFALGVVIATAALVVLRAGWAGQPRLAFWVVSGVVALTFVSRWVAPAVAIRLVPPGELQRLERSYAVTRALFTRRAFAVDAVEPVPVGPPAFGLDSLAQLAGTVAVWDPAALARAEARVRRGSTMVGDVGWQRDPRGLLAVTVERPAVVADDGDTRPEWTVLTVDAGRAGPDGLPPAVGADVRPLADAGRPVRVLVYPEAPGPAIVSGEDGDMVGDPIDGWGARLAHAWARRDLRLAFTASIDRLDRPRAVLRRDPRERLAVLVPFLTPGNEIFPAVVADSLFWVLHLYSANAAYPLSQAYQVAGRERTYFRHAAVAFVNAQSGGVRLVADSAPGPLAAQWIRRLPRLFVPREQLPGALGRAVPPATDGALVQAFALARFGARGSLTAAPRRLTRDDSTTGAAARPVVVLPLPAAAPRRVGSAPPPAPPAARDSAPAWGVPLLDPAGRVDGVLFALGGPSPRTVWLPVGAAQPRWAEIAERLRRGATGGAADDRASDAAGAPPVGSTRGLVRVVPVAGALAFVQPSYAGDGAATLAQVAVLAGDSVRVGSGLAAAVRAGAPTTAPGAAPADGRDAVARARALYLSMREALRRGDWRAFGEALDSLGGAVGARPR